MTFDASQKGAAPVGSVPGAACPHATELAGTTFSIHRASSVEKLIHGGDVLWNSVSSYGEMADGKRFVVNVGNTPSSPITVVTNWTNLLRK
jgi:hypothetical protein